MLDVKPFSQAVGKGSCGAACVKMILDHYGIVLTETEIIKLLKTTPAAGTRVQNIVAGAKKIGFKATVKDFATFKDIKKYLDKGIPLIVDWFSKDNGHYSVAVGLDKENIYIQDPELGHMRAFDLPTFMGLWFDFVGDYPKKKDDFVVRRLIAVYK